MSLEKPDFSWERNQPQTQSELDQQNKTHRLEATHSAFMSQVCFSDPFVAENEENDTKGSSNTNSESVEELPLLDGVRRLLEATSTTHDVSGPRGGNLGAAWPNKGEPRAPPVSTGPGPDGASAAWWTK